MVLVNRFAGDDRDLALAKGIVERAVDSLRGEAQARRGIAVDHDVRRQPGTLLVRTHIHEFRQSGELVQNPRRPQVELIEILRLQRVLVLGVALATADAKVLLRLKKKCRARHPGGLLADAGDHLVGRRITLRFELHEYLGGCRATPPASVASGSHPDGIHVGVLPDLLLIPFCFLDEGLIRDVLLALHLAE